MDIIKTKKITFIIFSILSLALIFGLAKTIVNYPKITKIELGNIKGTLETETPPQNYTDDLASDAAFDYELIGYRVDTVGANASVVVKKNNEEYVVQVGDLLENKYRLLSVSKNKVIFDYSGKVFELENLVGK